ncbi:MAG: hypothetical protein D6689_07860 [Deltaproteobacteria bacterium]|nr:MAG: hypothetical protein D6689_07860 [Deltaproteobacteria bacterium]
MTPPDPSVRGEPPVRNRGFLDRIKNPVLPPRKYDPTPWTIVVLEPVGELSPDEAAPPKVPVRWKLIGEAFETPVVSTTVGGELEIKNAGVEARRLVARDLLPGDPIAPNGTRTIKLTKPYDLLHVHDPDAPHLRGTVVAFPLRYHAAVGADGAFEIPDVPAGTWTVRVWYEDGWLKMKPQRISVSRRGATVNIRLPDVLEVDRPGASK